jgi:hypothetical protein
MFLLGIEMDENKFSYICRAGEQSNWLKGVL